MYLPSKNHPGSPLNWFQYEHRPKQAPPTNWKRARSLWHKMQGVKPMATVKKNVWQRIMAWKQKHEIGFWFLTVIVAILVSKLFICPMF